MNMKLNNGSISVSGADIKVGNDFNVKAKKDIVLKAGEENVTSSNSSSQMGIGLSADVSKGKIADVSLSKAGTKGRGNRTNYINTTVTVGGNLKTESENLILSGANVEADKFNVKAKNFVLESKQDTSERKDSSYGGSFSIDLGNPSNLSATMNGSKGNGEKEWVEKQTSFIARNGGKADTENFTNIGAVIGSENETEKLKISANKVVVKDVEDKNQYENIGGGITIGTDVPNVSVKHDKVDKEQINRATALNTDISLRGKEVNAEDLGFNTDKSKAQEKTKEEEKHVDVELHTDLIGEDQRNEIKYAFKKLGSLHEILDQKKFKESMEGVLVDKFKEEHQKEFHLIKDENLSLEDKQKLAQNLVEKYLRENGYQGVIPEVLLTEEAHSFTVDSKDKTTGAKRGEKIYFSIHDIADPDLAFSQLFGHEKAHMNTYEEGKDGEETSLHTREKIGSENKNKVFTEEEKANYLNKLRNKYKNQKSIEQQFAEAKLVPEKDKEHWYDEKTHNEYKYKTTFTKDETKYLTKKYKISEKGLKESPTKYIYFDSLDKNNKVFKDKKEFEKFQNELKEKIKNEKDFKKRKELEKQVYNKLSDSKSLYHNIKIDKNGKPYIDTSFPNEKYVNNVGQEAVFNKRTGKWINDGINNATYNVGVGELNFNIGRDYAVHLLGSRSDVGLWEDYGASPNDTLTREQRKAISKLGKKYFFNSEFRDFSNRMGKISEEKYQEYLDVQKKKEENYQNHLYKKYKERGINE
ncbi:Haemagluttinin repeat-containing protein [Fusobacterium necrophorum]|nr:Haemagluttinin repeat-containing protein [Fusobacterium necrophorum]